MTSQKLVIAVSFGKDGLYKGGEDPFDLASLTSAASKTIKFFLFMSTIRTQLTLTKKSNENTNQR